MSFLDTLAHNIRAYPGKTALEFIEPPIQRLSYAELDGAVGRTMRYLHSLGIKRGDRVALQLPKCLEFILLHLATLRLGAIVLPLNTAYPPDELRYFLHDSASRAFFADESAESQVRPLLADLPGLQQCIFLNPATPEAFESLLAGAGGEPAPATASAADDTAVIIYTSGTTGRPKGAQITHGNLTANLDALHAAWGWQRDDLLLHVLPIFHVHGLFVALHGALHAGATTLLMRKFDPHLTLHTLIERGCTVFMGVPTLHQRLLNVPDAARYDLSHMRLITSGSDRLPDDAFTGFQQIFGYTLLERYGMTETGMNLSNPLHGERRIGAVGLPLPGVEARVVDPETGEVLPDGIVGEVQVRGANVFKGYWQQPEKTAEAFTPDGWLHTGDLGLRAPDGYFTLQGRAKDLIITGGLNVYPPEVERVLAEHPAVAASAVIGCPDPEWGERIVAVVVLETGKTASDDDLMAHCRQKLAAYKVPRGIRFADALPRNAMGKVQKGTLRADLCPEAARHPK